MTFFCRKRPKPGRAFDKQKRATEASKIQNAILKKNDEVNFIWFKVSAGGLPRLPIPSQIMDSFKIQSSIYRDSPAEVERKGKFSSTSGGGEEVRAEVKSCQFVSFCSVLTQHEMKGWIRQGSLYSDDNHRTHLFQDKTTFDHWHTNSGILIYICAI